MDLHLREEVVLSLAETLQTVPAFSDELLDGKIGRGLVVSNRQLKSAKVVVRESEIVGFRVLTDEIHTLVQAYVHASSNNRSYLTWVCADAHTALIDCVWKCVCTKGKTRSDRCCSHVLAISLVSNVIGRYKRGDKRPPWMALERTFPKRMLPYMW